MHAFEEIQRRNPNRITNSSSTINEMELKGEEIYQNEKERNGNDATTEA